MNIAGFLGVDQSLVSKIEKEERSITADQLEKLSGLYGIESEMICGSSSDLPSFSIAFRSRNLSFEDMKAISSIQRIALNSEFLERLLRKNDD